MKLQARMSVQCSQTLYVIRFVIYLCIILVAPPLLFFFGFELNIWCIFTFHSKDAISLQIRDGTQRVQDLQAQQSDIMDEGKELYRQINQKVKQ